MTGAPLAPALGDAKDRTARARLDLSTGRAEGADYLRVVDGILTDLGTASGWSAPGRALVALGGYGRGELSPRSDVDLLFLVDRRGGSAPVDSVLYPLWDLGFDVGHALRTPSDCARIAGEDLTAATALLDGRLLLGDEDLWEQAKRRAGIRAGGSRHMRRWIPWLLADVADRRLRFGEVSHLLEPHIKEGRGGLRDLHAARWVLACLGMEPERTLLGLPNGGEIAPAYEFLVRVRNALHGAAGRKTDHLTFDFHHDVAGRVLPEEPIERFFEALHRAGHRIAAAWEEVASEAQERLSRRLAPWSRRQPPTIAAELAKSLERWAQLGGPLPLPVRQALTRGDPAAAAPELRAAAARFLRARVPLAPLLHELHHLGALGLIVPEVEALVHQVRYDARHAFTTGIHCMETLGVFEDLWLGLLEKEEPHLTLVAGGVERPWVARVAALCHDLGKRGDGGEDAEVGARIAHALSLRLGFDARDAEGAAALVRMHQTLPAIAFGRDLEDPASWAEARSAAAPPASLEGLAALAYADLKATNPGSWSGVWSDWKRDLLLTLYARASRAEGAGEDGAPAREGLRPGGVPEMEASQVPPDLLERLLRLAANLGDRPSHWQVALLSRGFAEVLGVARPAPHLLSSVAGALTSLQLDVLSLQIHAWPDGLVHLWIRAATPPAPPPPEEVARRVADAVQGVGAPSKSRRSALANPRDDAMPVPVRVEVKPDGSLHYTAIEVRCRDRKGLVRDLSRVFEDLGLGVSYALVTTEGPVALDVFHLKAPDGGRIEEPETIRTLLERVRSAVQPEKT